MVTMNILQPYSKLCTAYYDATKPRACTTEIAFYSQLLRQQQGLTLEAMSGSGRLLLPLWQEGFAVEGVDISSDMLAALARKLHNATPPCPIYQQDITQLQLPKRYKTIIIAVGSFQLISDQETARATLQNLFMHLEPGGVVALDLFVPWECLAINNDHEQSSSHVSLNAQESVQYSMKSRIDRFEQHIYTFAEYKLFAHGIEREREQEEYILRWYYPREIQELLQTIGFTAVTVQEVSFAHNPDGLMALAYKPMS